MKTNVRVHITGKSLQNNLYELKFSCDSPCEQFDEWFLLSDNQSQDNVVRKLHTFLRRFTLRRVKIDVACNLPPKKETRLYVGIREMQHNWYTKVLRKNAHQLNAVGGPDRLRLLKILMQLRKCCNHPYSV